MTRKRKKTNSTTTKTTASKKKDADRKKRIKIAIVGSKSVTQTQAIGAAEFLLPQLAAKYDITLIATVKEDLLGREMRIVASNLGIKTKTFAAADHKDQSNPLELATASLLWEAKRFIVVLGKGRVQGCALHAMEMLARTKNRKIKILELKD